MANILSDYNIDNTENSGKQMNWSFSSLSSSFLKEFFHAHTLER